MNLANEILYGDLASVQRALDNGAVIDEFDDFGFTPLIEATIVNNYDMVSLLLERGGNPNFQDVLNRTALHWAAENDNLDIAKLLLEKGANANAYSLGGQPPLVMPTLHKYERMKQLLYKYDADFNFANDFINTKILGHRFELQGNINIYCEPEKRFVELELEGFFLGISIGIIYSSLNHYIKHYAVRQYRHYFPYLQTMCGALQATQELIKYQHYLIEISQHTDAIDQAIHYPLLIVPVGYEGHAITFIRYGAYLAKCDRGVLSHTEGSTNIYFMHNARAFTSEFAKGLLYTKQSKEFITGQIHHVLGLESVIQLPIESQLSGNCSWANVEASLPTMLFFLLLEANPQENPEEIKRVAMEVFHHWREWDKDIALNECIQSFYQASPARKATKAALLGAILFQRCDYKNKADIKRAEKILPVLIDPDYEYVLKSYIKNYWLQSKTPNGDNLLKMLDLCGVDIPFDSIE